MVHLLKTGIHLVPASSAWLQLWMPMGLDPQSSSRASVPVHATSSSNIGPVPAPKWARLGVLAPIKIIRADNLVSLIMIIIIIKILCTYQHNQIQVADTLQRCQAYRKNHHTQFPTDYCSKVPLALHKCCSHQRVGHHLECKFDLNGK